MKKSFILTVALASILFVGCSANEDEPSLSQEVEGYILDIEGDSVLLLEDGSPEEFENIEDKFVSEKPFSNFDGPDDADLMYIDYQDTDENLDEFETGDEIEALIGEYVRESYPSQADGKRISFKD